MIYAFVGTMDDTFKYGLRGNGKSATLTYYLYQSFLEGTEVYTNYYTSFSTVITVQEMVNMILEEDLHNIVLGIDEIQLILNSIGTKGKVLNFIMKMASQTRKRDCDIGYTLQRFLDLHLRLRVQTDNVLIPAKYHTIDHSLCIKDNCKEDHYIKVYCEKPFIKQPIRAFKLDIIGQLYNSNEIINEEIVLDTPKTERKSKKEILNDLPKEDKFILAREIYKKEKKLSALIDLLSYDEIMEFSKTLKD